MADPFVHLRVASGYSLRYGASHPSALVETAAALEMDTLALTDRDGLYGAVRFAKACLRTGVAPVVGVDFALAESGRGGGADRAATRAPSPPSRELRPPSHEVAPSSPALEWRSRELAPRSRELPPRSRAQAPPSRGLPPPARGGEIRDPRLPRMVALASSRRGWASLCRLTSATHLAGERGNPVLTRERLGAHADDLVVLLGADSDLGVALTTGGEQAAERVLRGWLDVVERHQLAIGVTNQQIAGEGPGSALHAGRMLAFADAHGLTGVLTNAVRMAKKTQAPTLDVLDASRRLVPLDLRNIDRRNAEGYLKSGKEMLAIAEEVSRLAGRRDAERLIGDTRGLALRTRLDPRADIGLGEIHLPEFDVLDVQGSAPDAMTALVRRCEAGLAARYGVPTPEIERRLADELGVIGALGFATYFLTVAEVVEEIKRMGIRCAARGSGAGSLVNYLLGISGVDPIRYGLIMERFLSPLRQALPDIDVDVESARRTDVYARILDVFGGDRVACVAMLETYRVRHAVRDVGAALSLPPREIDAIAKAFPHIRAADARAALRDLPELRAAGLGAKRLDVLFSLVESLDGLPRHVALHPCGVLLSDTTLLDRTPVEASFGGFPMSQFDKDDVEDLGLLKLDVLGIRMQSSMAHALGEIRRVEGVEVDIDTLAPYDDPDVYDMIGKSVTLGCFQIESPGQRELVGKFGPADFLDVIIDISLFRPGPVKSDMVIPFLEARQGWRAASYLHPDLEPVLAETGGVVVFHEQIIQIVSVITGCTLAQGDEARRALGDPQGQADMKRWFVPTALGRGYSSAVVQRIWAVLESFASFGFCKAHAAAFALPTYQSAWLKRHYPAHFLAGVLTHDPGMYPKRLILEEARRLGVTILPLDINSSEGTYRVERLLPAAKDEGTSLGVAGGSGCDGDVGGRSGVGLGEEAWLGVAGVQGCGGDSEGRSGLGEGTSLGVTGVQGCGGDAVGRSGVGLGDGAWLGLAGDRSGVGLGEGTWMGLAADRACEGGWLSRTEPHAAEVPPQEPHAAEAPAQETHERRPRHVRLVPGDGLPDGRGYGIRLSLADVKGISETDIARIVAGRPYVSLSDFWQRTNNSSAVTERLVLAGAFDTLYGIGDPSAVQRRGRITRRDLLLTVADLERAARVDARVGGRARGLRTKADRPAGPDPRDAALRQSQATPAPRPQEIQLPLDFTDPDLPAAFAPDLRALPPGSSPGHPGGPVPEAPDDLAPVVPGDVVPTGLPELDDSERLAAELDILGLDASRHVLSTHLPFLEAVGVTFAADLLGARARSEVLIAGVKVATQTPPVRSGRRVVFLTLDDTTGPCDATFFEDAQGPYAATVFNSWMLVVRGELRRTGPRGVSVRATGAWDLVQLHGVHAQALTETGDPELALAAVRAVMSQVPEGLGFVGEQLDEAEVDAAGLADAQTHGKGGGMGRRRVLVHPSGFKQSPYADVKPAGDSIDEQAARYVRQELGKGAPSEDAPRKLWHSSPGSSGR